MRLDQLIVARGLAPTRSAAQRLIDTGAVQWRVAGAWAQPKKAGEDVPETAEIRVTNDAELRWASRGGLKLEGALAEAGIALEGALALDVGQSTGGFTDVILAAGARAVVGVEVGHSQLHARLAADPRVHALEGLNARDLSLAVLAERLGSALCAAGFDFITGDLSFISLTRVLPALAPMLKPGGQLLMLVKPQFELQPGDIGKGGLVKNPNAYARVEANLRACCAEQGLVVTAWRRSPIKGGDGNREFFLQAQAAQAAPAVQPA